MIFPQSLDQPDLVSFRTNTPEHHVVNFTPEKVITPKISINTSLNKLKLTYVILDQNNLTHIHDCLFEWKAGILTLNKVTRYTPDDLGSRTTTFGVSADYACVNINTSLVNSFERKNNQLVIY